MRHTTEEIAHGLITDPHAYSRRLMRQRDAMLEGRGVGEAPRDLIGASWRRSLSAHVDPEATGPPIVWNTDDLAYRQSTHPLAHCVPLLRNVLLSVASQAQHIMIVTDANGHILWCEGDRQVKNAAENVGLVPGALWSEEAIGTNAMGMTLAVNRPVQVYSAEHLVRTYTDWTCAAAPVHDPDTGTLIGAIDISGPLQTIHPTSVALVNAAAQLAEQHLRTLPSTGHRGRPHRRRPASGAATGTSAPVRDHRGGARHQMRLRLLSDSPIATVDGRHLNLPLRHAEILFILASYPGGLTGEQIAAHLYGDTGNPTTVRAEVHRLRAHLGDDIIAAKPYRIAARATADFSIVSDALRAGDVARAAREFGGPLLPRSEAILVRQRREEQIAALRQAALRYHDMEPLWNLTRHEPYDHDTQVLQTLLDHLPHGDSRRWWVKARHDSVAAGED